MDIAQTLTVAGAVVLGGVGLMAARHRWRRRAEGRPVVAPSAAPVCLALSALLWTRGFGLEVGLPLALMAGALIACLVVLTGAELRPAKAARARQVAPPPARTGRWRRGFVRFLLAGPVAFGAAMTVALLIAMKAPMADQTRLVLAVLLMPLLWALLMVTALAVAPKKGQS